MAGLVVTMVTTCGISPEDPRPGELTAVIVARGDDLTIDFGAGPVDSYSRVVVLTEDELLLAFERTWPGREPPEEFEYGYVGVDVPLAELHQLQAGGEPAPGPAVAMVTGGRMRLPWSGEPRYLCLGRLNDDDVIDTEGCVLVDEEPPVAVTILVHIGGLGLDD